ncbi:Na+/H+ antiporter subunit E [Siccirubricoccus sp. KC 17139]|uniref:Na+/H+ antiporter subunit E n=1 Tax=Siccirubricoccus soli TaxID=2899147 RepID=A0ABT1D5J5_9PROT|nr:Na+/H+ antiporter subunit E [Siccirubricoccus soli]MCO6416897.1 Na+/H+ antiporter subunit E [Siccirubricoccus soli]MCP2683032.1 Na+/H+ antiporter subunit E [Siccirubricoccus soli]
MRRLLPHPLVSAALLALWLLLNQTLAPGPALVGIVVALLGGRAYDRLEQGRPRLRRPGIALRLAGLVLVDVARSNLAVARLILNRRQDPPAGFIRIPLALRDPRALAVLAAILTATPGSAWVEFDAEEGWLLLHVLDLGEEGEWVRLVKDRYEQPLLEIFA